MIGGGQAPGDVQRKDEVGDGLEGVVDVVGLGLQLLVHVGIGQRHGRDACERVEQFFVLFGKTIECGGER